VNLGIKVPPEELVRAFREHAPDAIGLSGLLVKSAQMMVITAQDLSRAGIACPILVGGAALTNKFTRTRIAPEYAGLVAYAQDAMTGLDLANQIQDPQRRVALEERLARETAAVAASGTPAAAPSVERSFTKAVLRHDFAIPQPPDLKLHVIRNHDLDAIFPYINPVMLYTRHLGFKGKFTEALAAGDPKARELRDAVAGVEEEMLRRPDIAASAVYKFFRAQTEGDALLIYGPEGDRPIERFDFGRQAKDGGLSLVDFTAPRESGRTDYVAMFATSVGPGVRALADAWKNAGQYLRSHILQILALEGAEAFAELLHAKIREMWGFADPPETTMQDLFKAKYRGVRVSFGYPACPRLEDQAQLFRLLDVERQIGVHLTEGFMMEPEGSVSALVFHHPEARYFSLTPEDTEQLERRVRAGEGAAAESI
jgi:5-methyltetrahydrofolate--homocysteine methyltransferase